MRISTKVGSPYRVRSDVLAAFVFEGEKKLAWKGAAAPKDLLDDLKGPLASYKWTPSMHAAVFRGPGAPASQVVLVGLGKRKDFGPDVFRRAVGGVEKQIRALKKRSVVVACPPHKNMAALGRAFAEGLELASYKYDVLKSKSDDDGPGLRTAQLFLAEQKGSKEVASETRIGQILGQSTNLVRDLGNTPGNLATPSDLAARAREIARKRKLSCQVMNEAEMRRLKMGALLGVAKGSDEKPRFIVLEYKGKGGGKGGKDTIVLVGKGITFDSGGISLKPAQSMEEMKFDMCGGGAVIGTMDAIAQIGVPQRVIGLVPCTENLPGGSAQKPGDVVRAMSGKTIEVINTDAEGRLILADALGYASRYKPSAVIDLATLTGACIIALGHHAAGLMGTDEQLVKSLLEAGKASGERCWELPLWPEYKKQIDSTVADVKNTGGRPAGTITAAAFLQQFIGDYPWAHLDIAGVAWTDARNSIQGPGATGYGVRLLVQYLRDRAGS